MRQKLVLSTETLRVLDDDDLTRVVGGGDSDSKDKKDKKKKHGSKGSGKGPSGDGPPGCKK